MCIYMLWSFGYDTYKYEASGKTCLYSFHKNDSRAEYCLPLDFVLKPRWLWREKEIIGTGGYIGRRSPLFENDYNTSLSCHSAVSHTGWINGTIKPLSTLHWIRFLQCKSQIIWLLIIDHISFLRFARSRPILSLQKSLTPHTCGRFWKSQHIKFYKITVSMLIYRGFRIFLSIKITDNGIWLLLWQHIAH